jgi:hypothetical protein
VQIAGPPRPIVAASPNSAPDRTRSSVAIQVTLETENDPWLRAPVNRIAGHGEPDRGGQRVLARRTKSNPTLFADAREPGN